jgi:hypothetical protein
MKGAIKIKYLKHIIYYSILLILLGITLVLPKYNHQVFIFKHILIYILGASIVVMVIHWIYKYFLIKNETIIANVNLMLLRGIMLFMIIIVLVIISHYQLDYIRLYETPPLEGCYYYDEYGNYIHGSRITYMCPKLKVLSKTEQSLKVRAEYEYPNPGAGYIDGFVIVDINIDYDEEHHVTSYTSQTSTNYVEGNYIRTDSYDNKKIIKEEYNLDKHYNSVLISIKTSYSPQQITQTRQAFKYELDDAKYDRIQDAEHYEFKEDTYPWREASLVLNVTNQSEDHMEYRVYSNNDLTYFGQVNYRHDSTELYYERNPRMLSKNGDEEVSTYLITDKTIKKTEPHVSQDKTEQKIQEYKQYKDYKPMISSKKKPVFLKNAVIEEGDFNVYKMYKTDFGYQVEEYRGIDLQRSDLPYSQYNYFENLTSGEDYRFFELHSNHISLEFENYPIFSFNPMLKYLVETNKKSN